MSYTEQLERMQVNPAWQAAIDRYANRIIANRAKYEEVSAATGVPWIFVGCLHYRESALDFKTHLHNGDSLKERTKHVPAGRPVEGEPPFTWEESAIDALKYEKFDGKTDWSMENICDRAERYNGLAYKRMGKPSPYLWSGSNIYVRGKYVEDHVFDPSAVDKQIGVIPLYIRTQDLSHETVVRTSSRKLRGIDTFRTGLKALVTTIGGLFTAGNLDSVKEFFGAANGILDPKVLLCLVMFAGITWVFINWLDKLMIEDAKAGTWTPSGTVDTNATEPIKSDQ